MRYVFCETEEPQEHWEYVEADGKRVLDLGCGFFGGAHPQSTPEFFLERGAVSVVGVDMTLDNLQHITDPNIALIQLRIDSPEEIEALIKRFEPEVIKCDIEGGEMHLFALSEGAFNSVEQYAVEVHTEEIFEAAWVVFRSRGYKVKTVVDLLHAAPCKVIHAHR